MKNGNQNLEPRSELQREIIFKHQRKEEQHQRGAAEQMLGFQSEALRPELEQTGRFYEHDSGNEDKCRFLKFQPELNRRSTTFL